MASPPHPDRTFASAPRCLAARLTWGLRVAARTLTWPSLLPLLLLLPPPPALLLSEWESVGIRRRGNNDPCSCIAENLGGGASCGQWKQGNCGVRGALKNSRKAESARATWGVSEPLDASLSREPSLGLGTLKASPEPSSEAAGSARTWGAGRVNGGFWWPVFPGINPRFSFFLYVPYLLLSPHPPVAGEPARSEPVTIL